jgi:hypothetical protein
VRELIRRTARIPTQLRRTYLPRQVTYGLINYARELPQACGKLGAELLWVNAKPESKATAAKVHTAQRAWTHSPVFTPNRLGCELLGAAMPGTLATTPSSLTFDTSRRADLSRWALPREVHIDTPSMPVRRNHKYSPCTGEVHANSARSYMLLQKAACRLPSTLMLGAIPRAFRQFWL